ncbi:hypothetical protein R84981_002201 [Carnimonas sp. R-84981]|uniref:homoprotocatechuate degradation operon regulator HpaR n=1 Tax=Carnimonas bestiolae TaxID=3402172 RepID=UPI003EDBED7F
MTHDTPPSDLLAAESPSSLRTPRESLPIALLRARESVMTAFRPMLAKHDLTEQQWRVIRLLHENGEMDASDVAARAFVLLPSLTRITRTLEGKQVISRRRDRLDGRRTLLKLEPAGAAIIHEVLPDHRRIYQELEAHFGREWLADLLERLELLINY